MRNDCEVCGSDVPVPGVAFCSTTCTERWMEEADMLVREYRDSLPPPEDSPAPVSTPSVPVLDVGSLWDALDPDFPLLARVADEAMIDGRWN